MHSTDKECENYFSLYLVDDEKDDYYPQGVDAGTPSYKIYRQTWEDFLSKIGGISDFSVWLKCGICGSFVIPVTIFIWIVKKMEDLDQYYDLVNESLFQLLLEEVSDDCAEDSNILTDSHGQQVREEAYGNLLRLRYKQVVILPGEPCAVCEKFFCR